MLTKHCQGLNTVFQCQANSCRTAATATIRSLQNKPGIFELSLAICIYHLTLVLATFMSEPRSSMSFSALLPTSQQLTSLFTFAQREVQGKSGTTSRTPFRSCQAEPQQKRRSQSQRQLQPASDSASKLIQLSRRDAIAAALLALQLPAILPGDAAHALG